MFQIVHKGLLRDLPRIVSDAALSRKDFDNVCEMVGQDAKRARKVGFVAAREAIEPETISTQWEGEETSNVAKVGDWVVTNLSASEQVLRDIDGNANTYVISGDRFGELYDATGRANSFGDVYRAKGVVDALFFPGGFDIAAPWGEQQRAPSGYLVCNGNDIYGNQTETFRSTYEFIEA